MAEIKRIKINEAIESWNKRNPDLKQKDRASVAEAIGKDYGSLSKMNGGKVGKSMQTLNSLSEELDCTIDSLIEK